GGITFAHRAADETGGTIEQIARAFVVAREVFALREFVIAVEATDTVVATQVQTELYLEFRRLLDRAARWFVQRRRERIDIGAEIDAFAELIAGARLGELLRGDELARFEARVRGLEEAGVPEPLAQRGAGLLASFPLLDVVELARGVDQPLGNVARVYFALADLVHFDDGLTRVTALPQDDRWGSMA